MLREIRKAYGMCNMGSIAQLWDWEFICCRDVKSGRNFSFVSSLLFFDSCSRLWDNRANGGDICGVANGPLFVFTQVSSFWSFSCERELVFLHPIQNMPFNRTF